MNSPLAVPARHRLLRFVPILFWLFSSSLFASDAKMRFDIPAVTAIEAFRQFVDQSGTQLFFASDVVKGVETKAVKGEFTANEAVNRMLEGTVLVAVAQNGAIAVNRRSDPNGQGMAVEKTSDHPSSSGSGIVQGRVLNNSSSSYLNNARVAVSGTSIETRTDATGFYRLTNVPAGATPITVTYVGMASVSANVTVPPGATVNQDFDIFLVGDSQASDRVVKLDAINVAERQLSGQAIALQEQKNAPNIKNVISFEEFGDLGEGNIAEYLKYVPGLDVAYNPQNPINASIRGMPPSGTLITLDGATTATTNTGITRTYDFSVYGTANIERLEINKTPTPDLPANAVGGSINIVSKTGFSVSKPTFKYNVFLTDDVLGGLSEYSPSFGVSPGQNDSVTQRKIQPSYNLYYSHPLNDKVAFTLGAGYSKRVVDQILFSPTWDLVRNVQTANSTNLVRNVPTRESYSASVDWRLTPDDLLTVSAQRNTGSTQSSGSSFAFNMGAGNTGGPTFTQGAATGVGTVTRNYTVNTQDRVADVFSLHYKHNGPVWKYNGMVTYSEGTYTSSPKGRTFTGAATTNSLAGNLILRMENMEAGITNMQNPVYTATNRAGQPVDIYQANTMSVTSNTLVTNIRDNNALNAGFNVEREFDLAVPTRIKMGVLLDRQERMVSNDTNTLTFNPPGGTAGRSVTNYDVLATEYASRTLLRDANGAPQPIVHLSLQKLYELYRTNPTWWTSNEATRYTTYANNLRNLKETISAAYFRGDVKLMENRLSLIGGARYEHTNDKGAGPNDDITAIYVKNPDGTLARTQGGALIPITTNALEQARLRYTALGTVTNKSYDGLYPSLNAAYELTNSIILRAAYARTIGRPDMAEMIPGATVASPDATDVNRTITVNNAALSPWTANNFDLTFETYGIKGSSASVSLFQKDVTGFFAATSTPATQALVESYGVAWDDIYSNYTVVSKRNAGSASVRGIELAYRQSLIFIPGIGKRLQVFANFTKMEVSGPDRNSFNFSPERYNWGIGYYGRKFIANLNGTHGKPLRQALEATNASTPADTYNYRLDYPRYDLSLEYNFIKRFGMYASVRNLTGNPTRYYRMSPNTPGYARNDQFQYAGALISVGVKGEW